MSRATPKFTLEEIKAKRTSAQNNKKLQARLAVLEKESSLLTPMAPIIEERPLNLTPPAGIFRREVRPQKTMDMEMLGVPIMGQITRNRSHSFDDSTEQHPNANVPNTVVVEKLQKIKEFRIEDHEENGLISFAKEEKSIEDLTIKKNRQLSIIPEVVHDKDDKDRRNSGSTLEASPCDMIPEKESKPNGKPKRRFNVFGGKKEAIKGVL